MMEFEIHVVQTDLFATLTQSCLQTTSKTIQIRQKKQWLRTTKKLSTLKRNPRLLILTRWSCRLQLRKFTRVNEVRVLKQNYHWQILKMHQFNWQVIITRRSLIGKTVTQTSSMKSIHSSHSTHSPSVVQQVTNKPTPLTWLSSSVAKLQEFVRASLKSSK